MKSSDVPGMAGSLIYEREDLGVNRSKIRATQYPVTVNDKDQLTDGEYITETFDVDVEGQYVVITV